MIKPVVIAVNRYDADITFDYIKHYYGLGVRAFYYTLHKAPPELLDVMELCKKTFSDAKFVIFRNESDLWEQEKITKELTDAAMSDGYEWIIGSDPDEILILLQHATIQDFLKDYENYDPGLCLRFPWFDYPPTFECFKNVFTEFKYRGKKPKLQNKCIARFNPSMQFVIGMHYVFGATHDIYIDKDVAFFAHFQARNRPQMAHKMELQGYNWDKRGFHFHLKYQLDENPDYFKHEGYWNEHILKKIDDLDYYPLEGYLK